MLPLLLLIQPSSTLTWLNNFVLPLNLCPFAHKPVADGTLNIIHLQEGCTEEYITGKVREVSDHLASLPVDNQESHTSMLVIPSMEGCPSLSNFLDFMEYIDTLSETLPAFTSSLCQIAPFHPDFQFRDTPNPDPTNLVNASPHPTIHILRESDVTRAVDSYDRKIPIWERNFALLSRAGVEAWRAMMETGVPPNEAKEYMRDEAR